jgi:hypothetical protein
MMRRSKMLFGIGALALASVPSAAAAEGQLRCDGKFVTATGEVDLCTFTNPRADGTEIRILLLGIEASNHHRISITFDKTETSAFVQLWRQALAKQSASWQPIGEYTETGTDDNSHLKISAGPGVRLTIDSPARGSNTTDLPPANLPGFTAELEKAVTYVAGSV